MNIFILINMYIYNITLMCIHINTYLYLYLHDTDISLSYFYIRAVRRRIYYESVLRIYINHHFNI